MPASAVISRYIDQAKGKHREALAALAAAIELAAPDAEISLRRGVPAFHYRGKPLASLGDAAHHVSLYLMYGNVLASYSQRLRGYSGSSRVVRFEPTLPIPAALVIELVTARKQEIDRALPSK
jgi:uncharacterized protein YdhG (YjbR/CyaY superfamily)